jgi:hypothetical protein
VNEASIKWFDIALEEYKSLRGEVSDALKNQQSIVNYGLGAVGIVLGFGANRWDDGIVVEILFTLFIPMICNLVIFVWSGEVNRMSRAGLFIRDLERKINEEAGRQLGVSREALSWETWLRTFKKNSPSRKTLYNYLAIIFMFMLISAVASGIGLYHYCQGSHAHAAWWLALFTTSAATNLALFGYHFRYLLKVKN